jgi:uncharacterized Zn finger protein
MRITRNQLASLIDERCLKRREAYFEEGMVEIIRATATEVTAKCAGSRIYTTQLSLEGHDLLDECSCPAFGNFGPCKHMAALGYAVMAKRNYAPSEDYRDRKDGEERFLKALQRESKAELIEIVMQLVADKPDGYGY